MFIDKIGRFVYFTICWAVFLQLRFWNVEPSGFKAWNNTIMVIMLIVVVIAFPIIMTLYLKRTINSISATTFDLSFEELRINRDRVFYFYFRYLKLMIIALAVSMLYAVTPIAALIVLLALNFIDLLIIICARPFDMKQDDLIGSRWFYPNYPAVYHVTAIIQQVLFFIFEILFLAMAASRDSASSSGYLGLGYAINIFVVLLLVNGIIRLVWGVLKLIQFCYLKR